MSGQSWAKRCNEIERALSQCHAQIPAENLKMPIFQAHGDSDPLIPPSIGVASNEVLKGRGKSDPF